LGDEQLFGGSAESAVVDDGEEELQLSRIHVNPHLTTSLPTVAYHGWAGTGAD
jgi:hypothetical protein